MGHRRFQAGIGLRHALVEMARMAIQHQQPYRQDSTAGQQAGEGPLQPPESVSHGRIVLGGVAALGLVDGAAQPVRQLARLVRVIGQVPRCRPDARGIAGVGRFAPRPQAVIQHLPRRRARRAGSAPGRRRGRFPPFPD